MDGSNKNRTYKYTQSGRPQERKNLTAFYLQLPLFISFPISLLPLSSSFSASFLYAFPDCHGRFPCKKATQANDTPVGFQNQGPSFLFRSSGGGAIDAKPSRYFQKRQKKISLKKEKKKIFFFSSQGLCSMRRTIESRRINILGKKTDWQPGNSHIS